jgi:hypothetical protein
VIDLAARDLSSSRQTLRKFAQAAERPSRANPLERPATGKPASAAHGKRWSLQFLGGIE